MWQSKRQAMVNHTARGFALAVHAWAHARYSTTCSTQASFTSDLDGIKNTPCEKMIVELLSVAKAVPGTLNPKP